MKKLFSTLAIISMFSILSVLADDKPINLSLKITHVTVFQSGAQVTGISDISLVPGNNLVAIQGLSPYIDEQSIQVKGIGKFTVLSASLEKNYISELKEKEQIENLRKQIDVLSLKIEDEKLQTGILKEEESFLVTNKTVSGKNESLEAANFKVLFDFYRSSLTSIRTDILSGERKTRDMEKELEKLNNQVSVLQGTENMPSGQILVTLKSEAGGTGGLEISYLVQGAGWYPSYDIRVNSLTEPVSLIYKANVYQNTGVDWKNVKLTFSNATPNQSGNVPWLNPWYLDFVTTVNYGYMRPESKSAPAIAEESLRFDDKEKAESSGAIQAPVGFTTSTNTTSIEFNVDIPYSVETGGKSKSIDMMYLELPAGFEYQSVPKLDPTAFLVGQVREWQKYDLLEGEANLYFENTFVGKSMLNLNSVSDTLNVSLGRDMGIIVKREKRTDFTSERFIGSNKVVTRSWTISVRNNKKENVKIHLTDQIPVSQNKDIVVSAEDLSGGKITNTTGLVSWDIDLPAGQSKNIILSYSVKFPKNSNVIVE